ncbi:MAG TPA: hypothetical protein VGM43_20930 [Bryobacteraceae bacterium]|jgi:hypothetical protein
MTKVIVVLALFAGSLSAQTFSGAWQGAFQTKPQIRLMLQLVRSTNAEWAGTLYRIDQGGTPEAIPYVQVSGAGIQLRLNDGDTYEGTLSPNGSSIRGEWKQGGAAARTMEFQRATKETAWQDLNSEVEPSVSEADIRIIERAKALLNSPAKWNRADNRGCPAAAMKLSLYCALDRATTEVTGQFAHRGAAMQQARFVIDEDLAKGNHYEHRLMDYNNDPKTTFADVQRFFQFLEERVRRKLP